MQPFDCLAPTTQIVGQRFLEASAGTGKTFAVEHIVSRLLREASLDLEQILVVTFTRAAARELKARIRARIADAAVAFDRCQIFTIHGFCQRMLRDFAFEADIFARKKNDILASEVLERGMRNFFASQLTADIVSSEQLGILLKNVGSVEDLARKLQSGTPAQAISRRWRERFDEFRALCAPCNGLREEWEALRGLYKKKGGDLEGQVDALANALAEPDNGAHFNRLIEERGTLFEYLAPENQKVRAKIPPHPLFCWAQKMLAPVIQSAADANEIFKTVLDAWKPIQRNLLEAHGLFGSDELLLRMQKAAGIDAFRHKVQKRYRAVLIDEFQDTDPIQWDIFYRLFSNAETLYLIGDPKQAIYRFRNADLYTYLQAKNSIAPAGHFHLDVNFRSSPQLIGSLNALFDREWLRLPKINGALPYLPVKAGLEKTAPLPDAKGAVHFALFASDNMHTYIAREIQSLTGKRVAILVKDRYEAAEVQAALLAAGIPATLKSHELLSKTFAFEAMLELFEALRDPRHCGKAKAVFAGPFCGDSSFPMLRALLEERGLSICLQTFFAPLGELLAAQGKQFYSDVHQILELVLAWESETGFDFDSLFRFLHSLSRRTSEEAIFQRQLEDTALVEIMTMHASKGLEFDIVFALGLGTKASPGDAEAEAEKLRLLYVTMTRAKQRVYVLVPSKLEEAPIGSFFDILARGGQWQQELERLAQSTDITLERVESVALVATPPVVAASVTKPHLQCAPQQSSRLLSFTALKSTTPPLPRLEHTGLPAGKETGIILHKIFERLFTESNADTQRIVCEELTDSPWQSEVVAMIERSLDLELPTGFRLRDIDRSLARAEVEFLFSSAPHYTKGFIDLVFMHRGKLYFVDWKTHVLNDYTPETLQTAIAANQYDLQASIYREALARSWGGDFEAIFGGALYFFVRGPAVLCLN